MEEDKELVSVATFQTEQEAKVLQFTLNSRGVAAMVSGDVRSFPGIMTPEGLGAKVFVRRIEVDEAKRIMRELSTESASNMPAWRCQCGATVDEGFGVCWSCGTESPAASESENTDDPEVFK